MWYASPERDVKTQEEEEEEEEVVVGAPSLNEAQGNQTNNITEYNVSAYISVRWAGGTGCLDLS